MRVPPRSRLRRSAQTALYRINLALVRLLAPVLSFTCEEVWGYLKFDGPAPESVHMDYFPNPEDLTVGITSDQREIAARWDELLPVRDLVLKALDEARDAKVIGSSLEAAVTLEASGEQYELLKAFEEELPTWFISSEVHVKRSSVASLQVQVDRARGDKCERCWRYTTDVGSVSEFPTVCARCASVLPEFVS